jgi:hypothetical protein
MTPNDPTLPKISSYASILLSTFFIGLGLYYSNTSDTLLTRYTKEDGFIEWMTFFLYFSSFLLMFFVYTSRRIYKATTTRLQDAIVIGIGLVFLFGALEEISWFQRVIDIESGEFFMKHNRQAETNIHNLIVGGVNINRLIFGKIFFIALLFHNVILPIWARKNQKIQNLILKFGFVMPPVMLVVPYLILAISVDLFIAHSRAKEHLEILGSIHYFSALFLSYGLGFGFKDNKALYVFDDAKSKTLWSIAFAMFLFLMTLAAWILGNFSLKGVQF